MSSLLFLLIFLHYLCSIHVFCELASRAIFTYLFYIIVFSLFLRAAAMRTRASILSYICGIAQNGDCANLIANAPLFISLVAGLKTAPESLRDRCEAEVAGCTENMKDVICMQTNLYIDM